MKYLLYIILAAAGCYLLHKLCLWAEGKGWIFYRHKRASGGTLGNALLELQTYLEPSRRHILDERVKKDPDTQNCGDKPDTGSPEKPKDMQGK